MSIKYEVNRYNGVELEADFSVSVSIFVEDLSRLISNFKTEGRCILWLPIPIEHSEFLPPAINLEFIYHHADSNGALLYLKLSDNAVVPGYATHYIGAGGVVIDEKNRLLVVQERYHCSANRHYKLPGGALDPSEHIADAVIREVLEETGIKTEFISLNSFRHWHGYRFGKSDIYFVCRLKPLSSEIKIDENEIAVAKWMDVQEYLNDPETRIFNKNIVESALNSPGIVLKELPNYGTPETHELFFG